MATVTLYLAGGLFNAGERLHNLYLEKHLKALGYEVILPQREADKYISDGELDLPRVAEECMKHAADVANMYIGNIDGPDAESGTCVEYGITIHATQRAVVYRTDIRTFPEKEVGVNAMLRLKHTSFVYYPCYFTSLDDVDDYYRTLAEMIDGSVLLLLFLD